MAPRQRFARGYPMNGERRTPRTQNHTRVLMLAAVTAFALPVTSGQSTTQAFDENERVVGMEAFGVRASRVEYFGFQVQRSTYASRKIIQVIAVIPNTAAAKAGLKPGDTIVRSDGEEVDAAPPRGIFGGDAAWQGFYVPPLKRTLLEQGMDVTWTLDVISHPPRGSPRRITLSLPSTPPRWGAKVWSTPEGRAPATVTEPGPLAERAKLILDNGVAIMLREDLARNLPKRSHYYGFQWSVAEGRTFIVSQARGRIDIILQNGKTYFLTSPSGELERVVRNEHVAQLDPWNEIPASEAQPAFAKEVAFWITRVGKVSERWPLELIPEIDVAAKRGPTTAPVTAASVISIPAGSGSESQGAMPDSPSARAGLSRDFLRLPLPSPDQRRLFDDALAALDRAEGRWAYTEVTDTRDAKDRSGRTETIRAADAKKGKGVTMVRVDPSKPSAERFTLLAVNGQSPTPAQLKVWQKSELPKRTLAVLGDLPPLTSILDVQHLRVVADNGASTVFEVALRPEKGLQFPPEMMRAVVRLDNAQRAFEAIRISTRAMANAAVIEAPTFEFFPTIKSRVTVGLEVSFQTIDPAHPPRMVLLKLGGAGKLLFAKLTDGDREITRADFHRVGL